MKLTEDTITNQTIDETMQTLEHYMKIEFGSCNFILLVTQMKVKICKTLNWDIDSVHYRSHQFISLSICLSKLRARVVHTLFLS